MDLIIASGYDVTMEKSWSGTPYSIYKELLMQRSVGNINCIDVSKLISNREYRLNTYRNLDILETISKKQVVTKYGVSTNNVVRSRTLERYLKNTSGDVILQFGGFRTEKDPRPYFLYTDSSHDLALDYYKQYGVMPGYFRNEPIDFYKRGSEYSRKIFENAAGIFSMSKYLTNILIHTTGISASKIHTVYAAPNWHGAELPQYAEPKILKNDEVHIAFVATRFLEKGCDQLLKAVRILNKGSDKKYIVHIAGLKEIPEEYCGNHIILHGFLEKPELVQMLLECDIFVLPSRFDCFGIAFLEAMTLGLPCIGRDICAMPEIIDEGKNGYLLKDEREDHLADLIQMLVSDPDKYVQFSESAQNKAKVFQWKSIADTMTGIMESACK